MKNTSDGRKKEEMAAQISNDIAEGIDNGHTKKQLRDAVDWWASYASDLAQELAVANFNLKIIAIATDSFKSTPPTHRKKTR